MRMDQKIELKPVALSDILDKQFFIRHYQRGYRWTKEQVEQLLEDIDSFTPRELKSDPPKKTFYCLQPVVLKTLSEETKKEVIKNTEPERKLDGDWYEVVDGQQRLTTLYLILKYRNDRWLGEDKDAIYKIDYETRDDCVGFLESIKVNSDRTTVNIDKQNIDFYHISKAYQVIRNWELNYESKFSKKFDKNEFQSKLLSYSKVIWYEVEDSEDSIELFERLNLGKIPLTNAELTKALFLSTNSFNELPREEQQIKHFEIASMWDAIEHKLNEADKKFWSFITNKRRDSFETKIDLILDLIAEKPHEHPDHLFTFLYFLTKSENATGDSSGLSLAWQEIEKFYNTLIEWSTDRNLYHLIGYLIASKKIPGYKKDSLISLVKYSMEHDKKSFWEFVTSRIKASVNIVPSELRYDQHYDQIFNVLLLFNVETYRTTLSIDDFYPFKQHKSNRWSLEHIHAQNSEGLDQTKKDQWVQWLELHLPVLDVLKEKVSFENRKDDIELIISDVINTPKEKLSWALFSDYFEKVTRIFSYDTEQNDSETHGLANMALLSQPDNSALNSSAFIVKRNMILDLDKDGSFVPICTRRVFQGYYTVANNKVDESFFWGPDEKDEYIKNIIEKINHYLPEISESSEGGSE
jgi:hypothetical protein